MDIEILNEQLTVKCRLRPEGSNGTTHGADCVGTVRLGRHDWKLVITLFRYEDGSWGITPIRGLGAASAAARTRNIWRKRLVGKPLYSDDETWHQVVNALTAELDRIIEEQSFELLVDEAEEWRRVVGNARVHAAGARRQAERELENAERWERIAVEADQRRDELAVEIAAAGAS